MGSGEFADAPVSIAELRAAKAHDASLQTCRDALIMMLRDIDAGRANPDLVIICYRQIDENGKVGTFYTAGGNSDYHTALGVLEAVKLLF